MEIDKLTDTEDLLREVICRIDIYKKMDLIKGIINNPKVSESIFTSCVIDLFETLLNNYSLDIEDNAKKLVEDILTQGRNAYIRFRHYRGEEHQLRYNRWKKFCSIVCRVYPDLTFRGSDNVRRCLKETGIIEEEDTDTDNSQGSQARAAFRLKYSGCLDDMDTFFRGLETMQGRDLKRYYERYFKRKADNFKQFFKEVEAIVPERKGRRGWNYGAIVRY